MNQDYIEIAQFFLNQFNEIKSVYDIKDRFKLQIIDITKEKETQIPMLLILNQKYLGQTHYDFSFRDGGNFWGELSVDFLDDVFRNVRCQLFAEGWSSNFFGLNRKYKDLHSLFSDKYGKSATFDQVSIPGVNTICWIGKGNDLFITLSENKKQFPNARPYISFGIEFKNLKT